MWCIIVSEAGERILCSAGFFHSRFHVLCSRQHVSYSEFFHAWEYEAKSVNRWCSHIFADRLLDARRIGVVVKCDCTSFNSLFSNKLLLPLQFGFRPRFFEWQLKCLIFLRPWAMAEILLVGVMVAYVKLGDFAVVHIGLSLLSIIAMVICTLLAFATLDFQALWRRAPFAQQEAGYV